MSTVSARIRARAAATALVRQPSRAAEVAAAAAAVSPRQAWEADADRNDSAGSSNMSAVSGALYACRAPASGQLLSRCALNSAAATMLLSLRCGTKRGRASPARPPR
jgi:hypothetical protein